jgi:4-diphosphocytidyl-2-C-methyl-D-erythritol kinase
MNTDSISCTITSYAKVNLTLDVMGKRLDGFHSVESVMQTISLHDVVQMQIEPQPGIRISCTAPEIPTDARNLAWKAADLILSRFGEGRGVCIGIEKHIPVEAGLGGGSSNAAAVIAGLSRILGLSISVDELCKLAAKVGSDVPFFLKGGTAFVQGRGEEVDTLPDIKTWNLVVVKPPVGVSTAWCYRRLDEMRDSWLPQKAGTYTHALLVDVEKESCARLPQLLGNDLEPPAFEEHSQIRTIKDELLRAGAVGALMCGSGSAVFGLFDTEDHAMVAAHKMASRGQVLVEKTIGRGEVGCGQQAAVSS